jgi:hypothetical protein
VIYKQACNNSRVCINHSSAAYLLTRINKRPSKYLDEADPIMKANAKIMLLSDRKIDSGFLKGRGKLSTNIKRSRTGWICTKQNLQIEYRQSDAEDYDVEDNIKHVLKGAINLARILN